MRKIYRATKYTETVCFCGATIRTGMPINYVKTTEIPGNFLKVRNSLYRIEKSHAAHVSCVKQYIDWKED